MTTPVRSRSEPHHHTPPRWTLTVGRALLAVLLSSNLPWVYAQAQAQMPQMPRMANVGPIADPNAPLMFRPGVSTLGSGAALVNITTPNAAGMSLNKYQRFDAPAAGVVLNNSQAGGTALLGGGIGANPHLKNGTASTIVNEVTVPGTPSQLDGTIEVFGAPAAVIIANPSGIVCQGCGVVNTPRLTFATGIPNLQAADGSAATWANASRLSWDIQGGQIRILQNGIEGTVGRLDLLGQTLAIDGPLRAHYLNQDLSSINLAAGTQGFSLQPDGNWGPGSTVIPGAPAPATTGVAIDASVLGAMTAGQIRIIATDAGMGVNLRGPLNAYQRGIQVNSNGSLSVGSTAAVQGIQLSTNGHLTTGQLSAGTTLDASAAGSLQLAGRTRAGGDIKLHSGGDLSTADLATPRNLQANAKGNLVLGQPGSQTSIAGSVQLQGAGVTQLGQLDVGTDLNISADADTHLVGQTHVGNNVQLQAGGHAMVSGTLSAGNDAGIGATNVSIPGTLQIGRDATVQAGQHLSVSGTALVGNDLSLSGTTLDISGKIAAKNTGISGDSIVLGAGGVNGGADISGGLALKMQKSIEVNGPLNVQGNASFTSGTDTRLNGPIKASGAFAVNAGGDATVGTGGVQAGSVQMSGSNVNVDGAVLSATGLSLNGANAVHINGSVAAGGDVSAKAGTALEVKGAVVSGGQLTLDGGSVTTTGELHSQGATSITAQSGAVSVQGAVNAGGDLTVAGSQVSVAGPVRTLGAASVTSRSGDIQIQGDLAANKALTLNSAGAAIINGKTASGGATSLSAQGPLTINGELASGGATTLQTGGDLGIAGALRSAGNLQANAAGAINVQGPALVLGDAKVTSGGAQTWAGPLTATGRLDASNTTGDLRVAGAIAANGPVTVQSGGAISATALASGGQANVSAANDIAIAGATQIQGGSFKSTAGAVRIDGNLDSQQALTLQAQTDVHLGGKTTVGGNLDATGSAGSVRLAQDLAVGGNLTAKAGQNLELQGATSRIVGSATLSAGSKTLNQGAMTVGNGLTVNQSGDFINESSVQANGDLSIHARNIQSNRTQAGGIATTGKLQLDATQKIELGAQGTVTSRADTTLAAAQGMTNAGRIDSGAAVRYSGGTAANSGRIAGTSVAVSAALVNSGSVWGTASVSAGNTVNSGTGSMIGSTGTVSLGTLSNDGTVSGASIGAGATSNSGSIVAQDSIGISNGLINTGTVSAGGDLTAAGGDIDNSGQLSGATVNLGAVTLDNSGVIQSQGAMVLYGGALTNSLNETRSCVNAGGCAAGAPNSDFRYSQQAGQIHAGTSLAIHMASATNQGNISSGSSTEVVLSGALSNTRSANDPYASGSPGGTGVIASGGALSVNAQSISNTGGKLQAGGALQLNAGGGNVANSAPADGVIGSLRGSEVSVTGANINNQGLIQAASGPVTINASGSFSSSGAQAAVDAPASVKITAKNIDNASGSKIQAAQTIELTATAGGVTNGGTLYGSGGAAANIKISATGGGFANTGTAIAASKLDIKATGYTNSGTVGSFGDASLAAGSYDPDQAIVALGTLDIASGFTVGAGKSWTSAAKETRWSGTLTNYGAVTLKGAGKGDVQNLSTGQVDRLGDQPTDLSYVTYDATPPAELRNARVIGYTDVATRAKFVAGGLDGSLLNRASDASVSGSTYTPESVAQTLIWEGVDASGKTVQMTGGASASLARLVLPEGGSVTLTGPATGTIVGQNFTIRGADLTLGGQVDGSASQQAMRTARERTVNAGSAPANQTAATQSGSVSAPRVKLDAAPNMNLPSAAGLAEAGQPGRMNTPAPDLASAQGAAGWLNHLASVGGTGSNGNTGGPGIGNAANLHLFDWNQFGSIPGTVNAGSLSLDLTGRFTNAGSFSVKDNLLISAAQGIDNSGAHLKAGGQIALYGGGLNNSQGSIESGGGLYADLSGDVDNTRGRIVAGNDAVITTSANIKASEGTFESTAGRFTLDAGGNISLEASRVKGAKGAQVLAVGGIDLGATQATQRTAQETNTYRTETQLRSTGQTGGGDAQSDVFVAEDVQVQDGTRQTTIDALRHQGTVLDGGEGELTVIAGGNVNGSGAEMKAQGRTTVMGENVSLQALVDRTTTSTEDTKPAYSADPYARTTTVQETLSGGTVQGGQGVTIVARSNDTTKGNVSLTGVRVDGGEGGTTVLASGQVDAKTLALRQSSESRKDLTYTATMSGGSESAESVQQTFKIGERSSKTEILSQAGSVLDGGKGDLTVIAQGNVNGIGSDFKAQGTTTIVGRNVGIEAAKDRTSTARTENRPDHDEQHSTFQENLAGGHVQGGKGISIVAQADEQNPTANREHRGDQTGRTADGNVTLKGAQINAGSGSATVIASGNIAVLSQNVADDKYDRVHDKDKNLLRSKTSTKETDIHASNVAASQIKGENVLLQAGRIGADGQLIAGQGDIHIQGSEIDAKNNATLNAGRDILVTTGQATYNEKKTESSSRSGISASFFTGVSVGKSSASASGEGTGVIQTPSQVQAANVQMQAGRDATIVASQVLADQNVQLSAGRDINVLLARDSDDSKFESHSKSNSVGLIPGLSANFTLFGSTRTNERGSENLGNGSTSVISANGGNVVLQAGTDSQYKGTGAGNIVVQGADLLAKERVSLSGNAVDLQAADHTRDTTYHMDTKSIVVGARPAGLLGNVINVASDAYQSSKSGASDRLVAANALKAGYDAYKFLGEGGLQKSLNSDAINAAAGQDKLDPGTTGIGISVYAGVSKSSLDSETHNRNLRGTNIQAANIDVTAREGNITAQGAKLQAENIALDAAQAIQLGAAQNTGSLQSQSSSSSFGGGATFGLGQQTGISFQANAGQSKGQANGSETSHDNTRVIASNALSLKSGGNTELQGAQLAGKTVKADIGGDLKIETPQDQSRYESKQSSSGFNVSVCVPPLCYGTPVTGSVNLSKTSIDHNYRSATGQSGIAAGEGGFDIKVAGNTELKGGAITSTAPKEKNSLQTQGLSFSDLENKQDTSVKASSLSAGYGGGSALGTLASNVGANVLGNSAAKAGLPESGSERSQTQSVISPANVTITDKDKDKDGTSQQAANTLTSRDPATANGALKNNLTLVQAQDIQKNQQKAQDDIKTAGILGGIGANIIGDVAQKNDWSPQTKVLAHAMLGAGLAVIGGGNAGTGFVTGAANEMAVGAMGDYLEGQGIPRGSDEYKQLMMAGSAVLGTVVGKASGGNATDVALSGQTAKVGTENNHNKHHAQISDPNSKGNKASILANAQGCKGPNSCEAMAAGMAGQAATLTDDKIAGMCNGDTTCIANRKEERATYLQARDLAIAKTGPDGAAKIYLDSQTSAPYSKSELGAAITRFQSGNAQSGNPVDEYVRGSMDPVMFAAVLGVSPIDGDGGKGGRKTGGMTGVSKGAKFGDDAKLQDHFARHGGDFGAKSPVQYQNQADSFLTGPASGGVLEKKRPNGDIVRFNPATDEFGVISGGGNIRTYYKPDPAVHGKRSNLDYFNAQ